MTHVIVYGTEEPQDFQLTERTTAPLTGAVTVTALVGTGLTVTLVIRETLTVAAPTVAWLSQAGGTVRVSGVENLPVGRYHVRFKLTDSGGQDGFCPNDEHADVWNVVRR